MLVICHAALASATATPEMVIDDEEGTALAAASINLAAQFDITPDPKTQAVVGFVIACGMVYGPRVLSIRARKAQEARERAANSGGEGTAGVYAPNGEAAGTTNFRVHDWPIQPN